MPLAPNTEQLPILRFPHLPLKFQASNSFCYRECSLNYCLQSSSDMASSPGFSQTIKSPYNQILTEGRKKKKSSAADSGSWSGNHWKRWLGDSWEAQPSQSKCFHVSWILYLRLKNHANRVNKILDRRNIPVISGIIIHSDLFLIVMLKTLLLCSSLQHECMASS